MIRKLSAVLAVLVVLSVLSAACANQTKSYKIGLLDPMTGDNAVYGQSDLKGAQLAVDEINKAGGVNGVPLELVVEDNRMAAADSVTGFKKLAEVDKTPFVFGLTGSTVSFSTCPETEKYKIVAATTNATNPNLGAKCPPYFYRLMSSDAAQGPAMVEVLEYFKGTEAPMLHINNDYGIGVRDAVVGEMKAKGLTPTQIVSFAPGATDFRTEILKVKDTNPKVVFVVGYVKEVGLIAKQAKELGLEAQLVASVDAVTNEVPQIAGAAAEGMIAMYPGSRLTPAYQQFADAFRAKYQIAPTIWAEFGYDAVKLAAMAIAKGGYSGEGIQKYFREVAENYVGPSGPKQFAPNDNVVHPYFEWDVVKDGQWTLYQK